MVNPTSTIPALGASGAISGVLGCFIRLFPLARLIVLVPILFVPLFFEVPAIVLAALWFLMQLLQGTVEQFMPSGGGGVACRRISAASSRASRSPRCCDARSSATGPTMPTKAFSDSTLRASEVLRRKGDSMSAMDLFWLFFMLSALQPLLRQRMLEAMRMRKIGQLERKRNSRVILLVHRQETMRLLGFPIMRYIDVNDSEEVLRAIQMTDSEIPLDIVLHTPGGSSSRRRRSSARSAATRRRSRSSCRITPCPAER